MPRVKVTRVVSSKRSPMYVAGRGFASTSGKTTANRINRRRRRRSLKARVSEIERRVFDTKQFIDVAVVASLFATTWTTVYISPIPEGDGIGTRQAREVFATGLQLQGGIAAGAASTGNMRCRVVVIQDNENSGSTPTITDLFIANNADSLYNYSSENLDRFTILYDKIVNIGPLGSGETGAIIRFNKKMRKRIQFTGAGATATSAGEGALFLLYCVDSFAGAAPAITVNTRVWYDDK